MTQQGALLTMISVAVALVAIGVIAWVRRTKRDAGPLAPVGELPAGSAERARFESLYVATTTHDAPLNRIAAPGLAFRSRATVVVADTGVALDLAGQPRLVIARERIVSVGQSTVAIDRVVEKDGLTKLVWHALTGDVVDTYLRPQDSSARALADAIGGILAAARAASAPAAPDTPTTPTQNPTGSDA